MAEGAAKRPTLGASPPPAGVDIVHVTPDPAGTWQVGAPAAPPPPPPTLISNSKPTSRSWSADRASASTQPSPTQAFTPRTLLTTVSIHPNGPCACAVRAGTAPRAATARTRIRMRVLNGA